MIKKISHIGIAVSSIEGASKIYSELLGLESEGQEIVESQKVKVAFFIVGDVRIELLEPTSPDSPVAKFIEKRGEGVHHIAYETDDLELVLKTFSEKGCRLIDEEPRKGAHNMNIAFIHPKSTGGVLTEICQRDDKNKPKES